MKILILKTSSLGDIIHAFPALDYLRARFPTAQIDWVVEKPFAELVERHPQVNRVLTIESKKWRKAVIASCAEIGAFRRTLRATHYDVVFDLQGNIKSGVILALCHAKEKVGFGWKSVSEWPNALFTNRRCNPAPGRNIREDYLAVVQSYYGDATPFVSRPVMLTLTEGEERRVDQVLSDATLVCPGAAWPNKRVSPERLMEFLGKLDRGPYLFAWGSEEERATAVKLADHFERGVVLERCSLSVLQHVMAKCRLVVAMDSLPLHLAATTGTATMSFFGPSSAKKYGPVGPQHQTFQGACPYGVTFEKRCPHLRTCKTGACINLVDPNSP